MRLKRNPKETEDLATSMAAFEEEAYAEFSDLFGPRFRAYFIKKGLCPAAAEELAVSCISDIALKIEKYKAVGNGSFEAWVFTLARHALADWWRSHPVTVPIPEDLQAESSFGSSVDANLNLIIAVRGAVAQLSENDRELIRLRNLEEEHSYAEISEQIGISLEAARVRHFRALKRLKTILESDSTVLAFLTRREKGK